ncbi:MAG: substrate-binding domain-containing protein, partial [Planctomycetales bacterium]
VATALALARILGVTVESLFGGAPGSTSPPAWAEPPREESQPHWEAEVRGQLWRYQWEGGRALFHAPSSLQWLTGANLPAIPDPARNLVLATCDPAAGLLVDELWSEFQIRLIVITRNSSQALEYVRLGKAHVAGVHLADTKESSGHLDAIYKTLQAPAQVLHLADWDEGVAVSASVQTSSLSTITRSRIRWVGREAGSGARVCQDQLRSERQQTHSTAGSHWSVAEALRNNWADAGVCPRLVSEAAGLRFFPVRQAAYQLCYPADLADDFRIRSLVQTVRSKSFRDKLQLLPGISSANSGELAPS